MQRNTGTGDCVPSFSTRNAKAATTPFPVAFAVNSAGAIRCTFAVVLFVKAPDASRNVDSGLSGRQ